MNVYPEEIADPEKPAKISSKMPDANCRRGEFFGYESPRQTRIDCRSSEQRSVGHGVGDLELIAPVSAR